MVEFHTGLFCSVSSIIFLLYFSSYSYHCSLFLLSFTLSLLLPWLLFLSCKAIVPWKEKDWQRLKIHAPKHYICYHVQQQQKLLRRVSLFIYTIKFHCIWMVRYYHVQQFLLCFFFLFFILKNCDWSSFLFSFCWLIVCFLCERLIYSV